MNHYVLAYVALNDKSLTLMSQYQELFNYDDIDIRIQTNKINNSNKSLYNTKLNYNIKQKNNTNTNNTNINNCNNCKKITKILVIPFYKISFCIPCLKNHVTDVVKKRVQYMITENFNSREFYCRPIKINDKVYLNEYLYCLIFNQSIQYSIALYLKKSCFSCCSFKSVVNTFNNNKINLVDSIYNLTNESITCNTNINIKKPNSIDKKFAVKNASLGSIKKNNNYNYNETEGKNSVKSNNMSNNDKYNNNNNNNNNNYKDKIYIINDCRCQLCYNCLFELVNKYTHGHFILNKLEKANYVKELCICKGLFNLTNAVKFINKDSLNKNIKELNEDAMERLDSYVKNMCMCCTKFKVNNYLDSNGNIDLSYVKGKNYKYKIIKIINRLSNPTDTQVSFSDHVICRQCLEYLIDLYKLEKIDDISKLTTKTLSCKICFTDHYVDINEWKKIIKDDVNIKSCSIF